jgi:hypothetical protein
VGPSPLTSNASSGLDKILREQFVRFTLEIEIRQDPAGAGYLEIQTKVQEADIFDISIIDDLVQSTVDIPVDDFFGNVEFFAVEQLQPIFDRLGGFGFPIVAATFLAISLALKGEILAKSSCAYFAGS